MPCRLADDHYRCFAFSLADIVWHFTPPLVLVAVESLVFKMLRGPMRKPYAIPPSKSKIAVMRFHRWTKEAIATTPLSIQKGAALAHKGDWRRAQLARANQAITDHVKHGQAMLAPRN
jgi:hypothetical protein